MSDETSEKAQERPAPKKADPKAPPTTFTAVVQVTECGSKGGVPWVTLKPIGYGGPAQNTLAAKAHNPEGEFTLDISADAVSAFAEGHKFNVVFALIP